MPAAWQPCRRDCALMRSRSACCLAICVLVALELRGAVRVRRPRSTAASWPSSRGANRVLLRLAWCRRWQLPQAGWAALVRTALRSARRQCKRCRDGEGRGKKFQMSHGVPASRRLQRATYHSAAAPKEWRWRLAGRPIRNFAVGLEDFVLAGVARPARSAPPRRAKFLASVRKFHSTPVMISPAPSKHDRHRTARHRQLQPTTAISGRRMKSSGITTLASPARERIGEAIMRGQPGNADAENRQRMWARRSSGRTADRSAHRRSGAA